MDPATHTGTLDGVHRRKASHHTIDWYDNSSSRQQPKSHNDLLNKQLPSAAAAKQQTIPQTLSRKSTGLSCLIASSCGFIAVFSSTHRILRTFQVCLRYCAKQGIPVGARVYIHIPSSSTFHCSLSVEFETLHDLFSSPN